jgi:hypothetical protein
LILTGGSACAASLTDRGGIDDGGSPARSGRPAAHGSGISASASAALACVARHAARSGVILRDHGARAADLVALDGIPAVAAWYSLLA